MPDEYIEKVEGSYFGLAGHSHPTSKVPLPDLEDLNYGCITLNSKYNMVFAPGYGAVIIKKSYPEKKISYDDLYNAHKNAKNKRDNYVTQKSDELKDNYKKDLKNKSISYLKQKHDFDYIENVAEFIDFKTQCKFYDDELKQHGIKFIYIVP